MSSDKRVVDLSEKAKKLPNKAGCYLMLNRREEVIYVGKAKNLKSRVGSYFNNSKKSPKTEVLVSHIRDFEFIITANEAEALVLENNLIKKHSPRYNIMMRDDKSYPYVMVDHSDDFPRVEYIRRVRRSKNKEVFGPFVHGTNIGEVLRVITKSFQLRDCSDHEFKNRQTPCLLYQIKQCSAPCVRKVSKKDYEKDLNDALSFFRGEQAEALKILEERMLNFAANEEFEHAAIIRDNIEILEDFLSKAQQENAELDTKEKNFDVLSYFEGEIEIDIALYVVRNGILLGHKTFHYPKADCDDSIEMETIKFMIQYYANTHDSLPEKLFVPFLGDELKLFKEAMSIQTNNKVKVLKPIKEIKSLVKLTDDYVKEHQRFRLSNQESVYVGLNKLKDLLSLRERPILIECYDVAIFQGSSPTAAQIVFRDGKPLKKAYRHYHLKELPEGNNDFAMMEELITRRVDNGDLPDLFVIDGGLGQVNIVKKVLEEKQIDIPVVGIAKAKVTDGRKDKTSFTKEDITRTEERLIIPGRSNPYILSKNKSLFMIMTQMRDEAHRFSRRLHHKQEKKKLFTSWLDEVEGIGPKIKKKILTNMDVPMVEMANMPHEYLAQRLKIKKHLAKKIVETARKKVSE